MGFDLMLCFEILSQRSQGRLPVACKETAMAAHNEGLPDLESLFDDEWMDEQIEVGNCVVCYISYCLCIYFRALALALLFSFASSQTFIFMLGHFNTMRPTDL